VATERPAAEIETTRVSCAGSALAFLLRRLGSLNGGYRPGLQDNVLRELTSEREGGDLPRIAGWFASRSGELARLGNRIGARMVALRTPVVLDWVAGGSGHRGAVMITAGDILHPGSRILSPHALAITFEGTLQRTVSRKLDTGGSGGTPVGSRRAASASDGLVGFDPWPGKGRLSPLPAAELEDAHRRCHHRAFLLYSYGWS
jgi:hypothetical protein